MDPKRKISPSPQSTAEKRQCTESYGKSKKPITFSKSSIAPDVEIDILGNIYHLDSSILRHCSEFFDKSLSTTWWKEENTHFSPDGIKYRYKLSHDDKDPALSILEPVARSPAVSSSGRNVTEDSGNTTGEANDYGGGCHDNTPDPGYPTGDVLEIASPRWLKHNYDCMFRMFYHMPIDIPFECDWKLYGIKILKDIVDLAELYCSIHSVAGQIKGQIVDWMNEGGRMEGKDEDYQQLITFILVTAKIHSYSLFSDAFVHMVGLWSSYRHISNTIPDNIRRLIDQEYIRLHEITAEVDRKLGYYLTKAPDLEVRGALEQAFAYYQKKPLLRSFYQRVAKIRGDWAERNLHSLVNPLLVSNLRYYKSDAYRYLVCTKLPHGSKPWKDGDFEW